MDKSFEIYAPSEEYKASAKVLLKMENDARTQMIEELFSTITYATTTDSYHLKATTSSGEIKVRMWKDVFGIEIGRASCRERV